LAGLPDRNRLPATAAEQAGGSRCGGTKTRTRQVWVMARNNRKGGERREKGRENIIERDKEERENKRL